ncbi:MAG: hypothetical protein GF355_08475 [Candidatus Eisenbacteria bacterium]|nr:hypothetical protein [Candidatus Eisenbacteria bacterium]
MHRAGCPRLKSDRRTGGGCAMLNLGTQEVLVIFLVTLLLFGGRRLPEVARALGKGMRDFRRAMNDVQRQVDLTAEDRSVRRPPPSARESQPPDTAQRLTAADGERNKASPSTDEAAGPKTDAAGGPSAASESAADRKNGE